MKSCSSAILPSFILTMVVPITSTDFPVAGMPKKAIPGPTEWKTKVVSVTAEGDLVVVATVRELNDAAGKAYTTTWFDMWRFVDGKADEHWDGAEMFVPR